MKYLYALLLIVVSAALTAGKDKTTLSKGYARDSSTTITRFAVGWIVLNADSTLGVYVNGGDVAVTLYADSLPDAVRKGLKRINQDVKAELEK